MKWLFLTGYLSTILFGLALSRLNLAHQKRYSRQIPPEFNGKLDADLLQQSINYSSAKTLLAMISSIFHAALLALFVFGPWLAVYDRWISEISNSFVLHGALFFLGLLMADFILDVPFDFIRTFILETRFGFNTTSPRLWWTDRIKSAGIWIILAALLALGSLSLIQASPNLWWLWVWLFTVLAMVFVLILSPLLIEPLFHRFEAIDHPELEQGIRALCRQAGVRAGRIFKVDASRRTLHANAYFSGVGRQKRIVLFDTLLRQLNPGEILAVLAHEIGHWRHRHLPKRLLGTAFSSLVAIYLAFVLLKKGEVANLVGMEQASLAAQVLILSLLATIIGFPFAPLRNWLSRRHEWQADRFAAELTGEPRLLGEALIKLAENNLANLYPHPWYVWFFYSHPPLIERIRALRG